MTRPESPRVRLLHPQERPFSEHVRLERQRHSGASEPEVPIVSDFPAPDDLDDGARLLVARIAGLGAALALGFLAGELFVAA